MSLQAQGANAQQALQSLVNQANQQGGMSAQDPDARAIAQASNMKGDLVSNLQRMGQGNILDPQIRSLQQQAEKNGWSDSDRKLIQEMRKYQSDGAQDANAMKQITFTPNGGGGGGYSGGGGPKVAGGDELSVIAQLLGKYKGNLEYNTHNLSVGMDHNLNKSITSEDQGMIGALQPLYDELMKQKQLETQLMQEKIRESQRANAPQASVATISDGGMGHMSREIDGGGFGGRMGGGERWGGGNTPHKSNNDPYEHVRNAALSAAMQYMKIKNPHSLGSL